MQDNSEFEKKKKEIMGSIQAGITLGGHYADIRKELKELETLIRKDQEEKTRREIEERIKERGHMALVKGYVNYTDNASIAIEEILSIVREGK